MGKFKKNWKQPKISAMRSLTNVTRLEDLKIPLSQKPEKPR